LPLSFIATDRLSCCKSHFAKDTSSKSNTITGMP
jgi:hypothetical protein